MRGVRIAICLALTGLFGCGGNKPNQGDTEKKPAIPGELGQVNDGARCDTAGKTEVVVDLNHDGKPDIRKVYSGKSDDSPLVCREADLNFDGPKDLFVFYDDKGTITRDEADLDFDGTIDIITYFEKGKVVKQEMDTNSDRLIDRVRYMDGEFPSRVEGDENKDKRVDYWEYYESGKLVRIGKDTDGDGRADKWSRDEESSPTPNKSEEAAPASEPPKTDGKDANASSPQEG